MALDALGSALKKAIQKIMRASYIDEETLSETLKNIQRALLMSDVEVELVLALSDKIRQRALKEKPAAGQTKREHVLRVVYEELVNLLGKETASPDIPRKAKIMLVGLQGSGKTTTAAKLALYLRKRGYSPALVCTDTLRPGAYEQLQQLSEEINVPFYGEAETSDPVKIAEKSIEKLGKHLLLFDTAGRHKSEQALMKEMEETATHINPTQKWLVIDATIGQQAGRQAQAFHDAIGIDGVVLAKLDGSAKGGGAISAIARTKSPVMFVGVGEKAEDIELFDPNRFISRLLGLGDIESLVERAEEAVEEEAVDAAKSILKGKFTLQDMYAQFEAVKKMGPLQQLLQMMPGIGYDLPEDLVDITKERLEKYKVIMDSMTRRELENPKILNASRISRIAYGSGVSPRDVKELIKEYEMMQKIMKSFHRGRLPKNLMSRFMQQLKK